MKKIIVINVILLFIGIAVAPTINQSVVIASGNNDLIEVTTQACGIKGFGDTTVKLTREQYQNLEQYLSEFRARLNQTTTREEAVPIFKEAVVELNKYGLLPTGMTMKMAQQLVTGQYQQRGYEFLRNKSFFRNQMNDSNDTNYICLVYGAIVENFSAFSIGPVVRLISNVFYYANNTYYFLYNHSLFLSKIFAFLMSILATLLLLPWWVGPTITTMFPVNIFSTITFGTYERIGPNPPLPWYNPASGVVTTLGLNGKRVFQNQTLWGKLPIIPQINAFGVFFFPGIAGFTGFHILLPNQSQTGHYLGSALWVKIGFEPP